VFGALAVRCCLPPARRLARPGPPGTATHCRKLPAHDGCTATFRLYRPDLAAGVSQ